MFADLFGTTTTGIVGVGPVAVIFNLALAFVLSLLIALVYKMTHKGLSYSQTFVITLVLAGMIIAAVMMVIGNNIARAFGAFGAFSLIRFRTAIKDAKDMGFIFLVLAVGMAIGTGSYLIGIATTAFVLTALLVLNRFNFGSIRKFNYILTFRLDTQRAEEKPYKSVFDKYLKNSNILNIKAIEDGRVLLISFSVNFITESETQAFTTALQHIGGVSDATLITAKQDVEY